MIAVAIKLAVVSGSGRKKVIKNTTGLELILTVKIKDKKGGHAWVTFRQIGGQEVRF